MERNTERIPVTLFGITANIIFAKPHVKWKDAYIDMYLHLSGVEVKQKNFVVCLQSSCLLQMIFISCFASNDICIRPVLKKSKEHKRT